MVSVSVAGPGLIAVAATLDPLALSPWKKWILCGIPLSLFSKVTVTLPAGAVSVVLSNAMFCATTVRLVPDAVVPEGVPEVAAEGVPEAPGVVAPDAPGVVLPEAL